MSNTVVFWSFLGDFSVNYPTVSFKYLRPLLKHYIKRGQTLTKILIINQKWQ
jgi:hypothetical protein